MIIFVFSLFADSLFARGEYALAIKEYKRILTFAKNASEYVRIYDRLSTCYFMTGRYKEGFRCLSIALNYSEEPSLIDYLNEKAIYFYLLAGNYEEVSNLLKYQGGGLIDTFKAICMYVRSGSNFYSVLAYLLPGSGLILEGCILKGMTFLCAASYLLYSVYKDVKNKKFDLIKGMFLFYKLNMLLRLYQANINQTHYFYFHKREKKIKKRLKKLLPYFTRLTL